MQDYRMDFRKAPGVTPVLFLNITGRENKTHMFFKDAFVKIKENGSESSQWLERYDKVKKTATLHKKDSEGT